MISVSNLACGRDLPNEVRYDLGEIAKPSLSSFKPRDIVVHFGNDWKLVETINLDRPLTGHPNRTSILTSVAQFAGPRTFTIKVFLDIFNRFATEMRLKEVVSLFPHSVFCCPAVELLRSTAPVKDFTINFANDELCNVEAIQQTPSERSLCIERFHVNHPAVHNTGDDK